MRAILLLHEIGFATNSIATIRRELLPHGFALTRLSFSDMIRVLDVSHCVPSINFLRDASNSDTFRKI